MYEAVSTGKNAWRLEVNDKEKGFNYDNSPLKIY